MSKELSSNLMKVPPKVNIWFHLAKGGLGDSICRLTPIRYVLNNYPWVNPSLITHDYFVPFAKHIFPRLEVRTEHYVESMLKVMKVPLHVVSSDPENHTLLRSHLVEHAFNVMLDVKAPVEQMNYIKTPLTNINITSFNLPEKYVVITSMYTAEVREFNPDVVNKVVKWVLSKGYTPVFLGSEKAVANKLHVIEGKTKVDLSEGINLINKTSLLEAAKIMSQALAVVGVDNGLLHLAATTDVPIVFGYTTVDPLHRNPIRHGEYGWNVVSVTPPKSLDCRFCQSRLNFVYKHNFTTCFEGHLKCVKEMNSSDYITALEEAIHNDRRKKALS